MRQGILMWFTGMIGVLFMLLLLPGILSYKTLSIPLSVVLLIQFLQSVVLVALAVWIGCALSPKVNLHAPCFEARTKFVHNLRPQLIPGFLAGLIVGIFLIGMNKIIPAQLLASAAQFNPMVKILSEIFYGGITEEIVMRWGLMTLLLWILWQFTPGARNPSTYLVWISIVVSAVLFALAHLPAAHALVGSLTQSIVTYIIIGNTAAGIIFGFLYWRFGLEAAMIAHASAHLIKEILGFLH